MHNKRSVFGLLLALSATSASADDFPPGTRLGKVAEWLLDVKKNYANDTSETIDIKECTESLAAMKAGTVATSSNGALEKFGATRDEKLSQWVLPLPKAEALCAEATTYKTALKDYRLFMRLGLDMWMLDDTTLGPGIAASSVKQAAECSAAVKTMIAAGIPTSFPYVIEDRDDKVLAKTVGELDAGVCQATAKGAAKYSQKLEEEERARNAKLTKAGITGDKMYWWKHYDGNVFTAGGGEPQLAGYGKASVWFAFTYSSDPDIHGNHLFSVRRYQFSGNKLAKQTEKTYRKPLSFKNAIGSVMK